MNGLLEIDDDKESEKILPLTKKACYMSIMSLVVSSLKHICLTMCLFGIFIILIQYFIDLHIILVSSGYCPKSSCIYTRTNCSSFLPHPILPQAIHF